MRLHLLGTLVLFALAGCDDPTRPAEPVSPAGPAAAAAAATAAARLVPHSLGTLGGTFSQGTGINERTEVAGFGDLPTGELRGFLWRPSTGLQQIVTLGGDNADAINVNDRTEVVGESEFMPGSDASRAYIWSESRGIQNLGSLGGRHSAANSINNRREVVGFAELANGRFHAFLWAPGHGMRDLGTLGGNNSTATDINDQSVVAGVADFANGSSHAFRWTAARGMEDLGTFTHVPTDPSQANGISQTGLITGFARTAVRDEAFLWTRAGGLRGLGTLGGFSVGTGVNTHRRVVGFSNAPPDLTLPFLWTPEGGIEALATLGGDFGEASYLNEFGDIIGFTTRANGALRATLWKTGPGALAASPTESADDAATGPADPRPAACAAAGKLTDRPRPRLTAIRKCLGR